MTANQKRNSLKAARLYLEMRGHKLLEQGWSAGKYRIDLITSKDGVVEFTHVSFAPEGSVSDVVESAKEIEKLKSASDFWLDANKYSGKHKLFRIELYGNGYQVLSFNDL